MSAVAIGVIFRFPTAANRDGHRLVEFEYTRRNVRDCMGSITKRRILRAGAAAIGHAFGHLLDDGGFDEIFVR